MDFASSKSSRQAGKKHATKIRSELAKAQKNAF
jgi:hypothetical protein